MTPFSPPPEVGSVEHRWTPRRKGGLETPLHGRFTREGKRLVFAPSPAYDALVLLCLVGGPLYGLITALGWAVLLPNALFGPAWVGIAVGLAGLWAAFSNERMTVNLTNRTTRRLEGQGWMKRLVMGSLDDLDAVVLMSEVLPMGGLGGTRVTYRLVLFWKGHRQPLLIVESETATVPPGAPVNTGAGRLHQLGLSYAGAMGVRFFDNAHLPGRCPLPVV